MAAFKIYVQYLNTLLKLTTCQYENNSNYFDKCKIGVPRIHLAKICNCKNVNFLIIAYGK